MSAAVRWLALVMIGWAGARAATLGLVPGSDLFTLGRTKAPTAQVVSSAQFPALEPAIPFYAASTWPAAPASSLPMGWAGLPIVIPYQVRPIRNDATRTPRFDLLSTSGLYSPIPDIADWPRRSVPAAAKSTVRQFLPSASAPTFQHQQFDRIQLAAWALLRAGQGVGLQPRSLASAGTLGGSQAGARLMYRFSPELAASLRTTSAVGTSQSEVAAGVRITPSRSLPISFTVERRQAIGRDGGRSAFALFAEGGLYRQAFLGLDLDSYAQAGVVGIRDRALFADGAIAFTRPVHGRFSGGFGLWGGIQPGLHRIDAGPRLSYRVRPNVRVHVDWRQRLSGRALPQSGAAITLAGDF